MNKKEVAEIKRRFKQSATTITRLCGCYVNAEKEKVLTFNKNFLNLPDEEFYKYLEIAKKTLSGTIGNNLVELEFPRTEEERGGKQFGLMALRESALKEDAQLDAFFDMVIDTYDYAGNFLILLFHDCYDIPMKATDETKIGESDEVFQYILCAICPVTLSKPALGYKAEEKEIGARERDWVVSAPESGFIFPCFTDRSTDIHSVMTYNKNTKEPHKELWEDVLGCSSKKLTSDEKKKAFFEIVKNETMSSFDTEDDKKVDVQQSVIAHIENTEDSEQGIMLTKEEAKEIFEQSGIEESKAEKMAEKCLETLGEQMPVATELVSASEAKKAEEVAEKKRLVKENEELKAIISDKEEMADEKVIISVSREKAQKVTYQSEGGKTYLKIPIEENDVVLVNGDFK